MEEREILLEQIIKVLKDIETNTCNKEVVPDTDILDKKLNKIIELHQEEIGLLKLLTADRCTCKKHRHREKVKKEKKGKKGD